MIKAEGLRKSYGVLEILKGVDIQVAQGESVCINGPSGAGKTTLLHILGTLDRPDKGSLSIAGANILAFKDEQLARFRNETLGFVFQFHHLLGEFSALENVMMPSLICGKSRSDAERKAIYWLERVGLRARLTHFPDQLSGGERQRVAIARSLVMDPQVLLADEPTGNLDSNNATMVEDLFFQLQAELGLTLIVVTHNQNFASRFGRTLTMQDGTWA